MTNSESGSRPECSDPPRSTDVLVRPPLSCRGPDRAAPGGRGRARPRRISAEEVARLEARHLTNIRQVTSGLARAGEGYFSPDGQSIIFQAVPNVPPSIFHHPKPDEDGYQIFLGPLEG